MYQCYLHGESKPRRTKSHKRIIRYRINTGKYSSYLCGLTRFDSWTEYLICHLIYTSFESSGYLPLKNDKQFPKISEGLQVNPSKAAQLMNRWIENIIKPRTFLAFQATKTKLALHQRPISIKNHDLIFEKFNPGIKTRFTYVVNRSCTVDFTGQTQRVEIFDDRSRAVVVRFDTEYKQYFNFWTNFLRILRFLVITAF